jgi:hypothetical protein
MTRQKSLIDQFKPKKSSLFSTLSVKSTLVERDKNKEHEINQTYKNQKNQKNSELIHFFNNG